MKSKLARSLTVYVVLVVGVFAGVMLTDRRPTLGLDLEGGVSVVLQPVVDGERGAEVPEESLELTRQIIDERVNAFGVGEPDITIQGNTLLVQLPGIKDQQRVLDQIGKTAELRFRPVLEQPTPAPPADAEEQIADLRSELGLPEGVTAMQVAEDEQAKITAAAPPAEGDGAAPAPEGDAAATPSTIVVDPATPTTAAATGEGTGGGRSTKGAALRRQSTTTAPSTTVAPSTTAAPDGATTTVPVTTTTTPTAQNQYGVDVYDPKFAELVQLEQAVANAEAAVTSAGADERDQPVTLYGKPDPDGNRLLYRLGPTLLTGKAIETASAGLNSQDGRWEVRPTFKAGKDGIDLFNAAAAKCNAGDPICPALPSGDGAPLGQLAIVLDGVVQSAPSINSASFDRDQIQISGSFTEIEAKDLAQLLKFGSLPLILEPQQVQTVSATLGDASVRAGIIAALLGLAFVALYLIAYYRVLGVVVMVGLLLGAAMLVAIVSFFGDIFVLTLSGIVGTIVSIGVSLDSSIVYFENLKEDVRRGRSLRSVAETSFEGAFGTIVKANSSSFIGAVVLYLLSVGPVRGFALYLGLSTILDVMLTYFFVRPATILVSRSKLGSKPGWFGIDVDAPIKPRRGRRGVEDVVPDVVATEGGAR